MPRPIIKLPFPGFYHSWYSDEIDQCETQYAENEAEREKETYAPELRLDADDFATILFDVTQYSIAYHHIAREYVASFDAIVSDELDIPLKLKFEAMKSPREYNFETDRVFAFTTWKALRTLLAMSKRDKHVTLAKVISDRFTSYDGFISFYSNDLASWLAKPFRTWDHNELETLLLACMTLAGIKYDDEMCFGIFEHMSENSDFYNAHNAAVDWPKFESKVAELRADKIREAREIDPDYVPPAERCPLTLDLFRDYKVTP